MKRSWTTILLFAGLVGLLVLLGVLQYRWQSQISVNEGERMHKRLQEETSRFAEDFNREIQGAYFNFRTDADTWRKKNWNEFNERLDYWQSKTAYSDLIRDFYFFESKSDAAPLRYDRGSRSFQPANWTPELRSLHARLGDGNDIRPIFSDIYTLAVPVHEAEHKVRNILLRQGPEAIEAPMKMPVRYGNLIVELNEATLKDKVLPDLAQKHFPEGEFNLAVVDRANNVIFHTQNGADTADATAGLFDLSPDNFVFYANKDMLLAAGERRQNVVVSSHIESRTMSRIESHGNTNSTLRIEMQQGDEPKTKIFAATDDASETPWTLMVQHREGSIAVYVANTKFRNLTIGFGILALLGAAVSAIIFSAQRAKVLAQRQVDFVSSVSHEFRTPLAVIYSAGENLADGVTKDDGQVARYGNLIKGEGKKLSAMVEQILDFAGARSGRRKYTFTDTSVADVVKDAIVECRPLIDGKGVQLDIDIAGSLPRIEADQTSLSQAIQNLIVNSIKYSNGERWMRIAAENSNSTTKLIVEDHGIGISKSDLRHIFEPFYRAKDVVNAQIHGNGLGLSIVKQIAEAHGGSVMATSEVGKGSRFTIELPCSFH